MDRFHSRWAIVAPAEEVAEAEAATSAEEDLPPAGGIFHFARFRLIIGRPQISFV